MWFDCLQPSQEELQKKPWEYQNLKILQITPLLRQECGLTVYNRAIPDFQIPTSWVPLFPRSLFCQICCHLKADPHLQRGPGEEHLGPHLPPLPGETLCNQPTHMTTGQVMLTIRKCPWERPNISILDGHSIGQDSGDPPPACVNLLLIRVATVWCTARVAAAEPGWSLLPSSRISGWATFLWSGPLVIIPKSTPIAWDWMSVRWSEQYFIHRCLTPLPGSER